MYLSKLTLDPQHPQARRDLSNRYDMHRTLVRAFAPDEHSPPARFLWRLEPTLSLASLPVVLVQSGSSAQWSALDTFPGYAREILGNKPVDLEQLVQAGTRYRFRLHANPTVTREGKRLGLCQETDQLAWLSRQGEARGFGLIACLRSGSERIHSRQGKSGQRITVQSVLFEGILETKEPDGLRLAVRNGLGHGKAWGLGLLSLARIAG